MTAPGRMVGSPAYRLAAGRSAGEARGRRSREPSPRLAPVALASVAVLFAAVRWNRTAAIDLAIALRIEARSSPGLGRLMWLVSRPGVAPYSRIIPPGIVALLWLRGLAARRTFSPMSRRP